MELDSQAAKIWNISKSELESIQIELGTSKSSGKHATKRSGSRS